MVNNLFKNKIKENFSIISNSIVNCPELTCGAKGILCYLCSKPDNWQFYMDEIQKHFKDNIKKYIKELSEKKVLIRTKRCLGQSKGFCWDWEIDYDTLSLLCNSTIVENHYDSEIVQYNNTESNSNTEYINNIKEKNIILKKEKFEKPDVEEVCDQYFVDTGCKNFNEEELHDFAERFINYYDSVGWKVGNHPMKDWRACVRTWIRNEKKYKK